MKEVKSRTAPASRIVRSRASGGPRLISVLALALWAQGVVAACAVFTPKPEMTFWQWGTLIGLLLAAIWLRVAQPYIQDWLSAMRPPERVGAAAIIAAFVLIPVFFDGLRVVPEGFALALIPSLAMAADATRARRYLFYTFITFWFALARMPEASIFWVLGFGAATLFALSAIHFTFVGAPFGLRGWWPALQMLRAVAIYFVPSALAAWWIQAMIFESPAVREATPPPDSAITYYQPQWDKLSPEQWLQLAARAGMGGLTIMAVLVVLHLFRRRWNRRLKLGALPKILGAEVSEVDYVVAPPKPTKAAFTGRRGEIIRLWRQWTKAREDEGLMREPSETAAEFSLRSNTSSANASDAPTRNAILQTFERAHYGAEEPTPEAVEQMREWVAQTDSKK